MSRLRFVFVITALVALATALAACGGSESSDRSPRAVVEEATLAGIDSGNLDLAIDVNARGREGGNLEVSVSGPFESEGEGKSPQLDIDATAQGKMNGKDIDFDGGLVLLPNSAYVAYEGTEYEVDPTTFSFVESALKQAQRKGGAESDSAAGSACREEAEKLKVASFIDNPRNEGEADVGGTATTKLSGDLDVAGAIDALLEACSEDPACKGQLGATRALPSPKELKQAEDEVKRSVKSAQIELYVGEDDIIRRLVARIEVTPKKRGPSRVEIDLDLTLIGVNEEQEISAPAQAKPLNRLFLKLGVNPLELAGALQGGDIEGLLERLGGAVGLGPVGGLGGASSGGGSSSGGGVQSYAECIQGASSAADLQKCAAQL